MDWIGEISTLLEQIKAREVVDNPNRPVRPFSTPLMTAQGRCR